MPKSGESKEAEVIKETKTTSVTKKKNPTAKKKVTESAEKKISEEAKSESKKIKETNKTTKKVPTEKKSTSKSAMKKDTKSKSEKEPKKKLDKIDIPAELGKKPEIKAEVKTKNEEEKKSVVIEPKPQPSEQGTVSKATEAYNLLEENKVNQEISLSAEKKNRVLENKNSKSDVKDFHTLEVVTLVVLTCIISLAVGGVLGIKFKGKNIVEGNYEIAGEEIQQFIKDYNYLIDNYYGEIDKKELLNTAFKSMVDSLGDAYSGTIDESTSNNFDIELKGDYEGLGIEIINDEDLNILIYGIIPNSPASEADIKVGDKLVKVNDTEVSGMVTTDFINQIVKGSGATEFTIELEREGEIRTIILNKKAITLESVSSKVYHKNGKRIAYIKISIFAENTYDQFKTELKRMETEGFESLIIDLRDNSGGHLTSVENMISLFLDTSHVIYQTENKDGVKKVYSKGNVTKNYPIVIVGNAMSASASEVMIGALTEEYGAILIGNQSFGKGTVQELHRLSNGDEYKFTTKKWLTPKGNWVHNNGIQPKIEVTLSKEYYSNPIEENDNQLQAAINYLAGIIE